MSEIQITKQSLEAHLGEDIKDFKVYNTYINVILSDYRKKVVQITDLPKQKPTPTKKAES